MGVTTRSVAILGAGIGAKHLEGYLASPELWRIAALCDRDRDRAGRVLAELGRPDIPVSSEIGEALTDPSIDAIDVCLPPRLHVEIALWALEEGKHVVLEKPIATSLADVDRLETAASAANRRVFPVFQYRYGAASDALRALGEAGLSGEPLAAALETHWDRSADYYAPEWRGTWAGERGGAVLGHAIHAHDLLRAAFGPVRSVSAQLATRVNPIEVDDCAALAFEMANGAVASSSVTLGGAGDSSRLRLVFEKLTAESASDPYAPMEGRWRFLARHPDDQELIDHTLAGLERAPSGFAGLFAEIAKALSGEPARAPDLADGRASIELVTAIYHAARTGERARLPLGRDHPLYAGWAPRGGRSPNDDRESDDVG